MLLKILGNTLLIIAKNQIQRHFFTRGFVNSICNDGKGVLTFVHRSTQFTGSQGPIGPWLWPSNCCGMAATGW